jgi:hypothetical protein
LISRRGNRGRGRGKGREEEDEAEEERKRGREGRRKRREGEREREKREAKNYTYGNKGVRSRMSNSVTVLQGQSRINISTLESSIDLSGLKSFINYQTPQTCLLQLVRLHSSVPCNDALVTSTFL